MNEKFNQLSELGAGDFDHIDGTLIDHLAGTQAEEIVYLYCACDRKYFWPQFADSDNPEFKNRFTGQIFYPEQKQLMAFCELTAANEIEIALDNQNFIDKYGFELYSLLKNMQNYLSSHANLLVDEVLGNANA